MHNRLCDDANLSLAIRPDEHARQPQTPIQGRMLELTEARNSISELGHDVTSDLESQRLSRRVTRGHTMWRSQLISARDVVHP